MKNLFLSNSPLFLVDALEEQLFSGKGFPLKKKFIVIPHKRDKESLIERFARHRGAAVGLQFFTLPELFSYPRESLTALYLEDQIHQHLNEETFAPVRHYLDGDLSKIPPLARALAKTFSSYALYQGTTLGELSPWQKMLWKQSLPSPSTVPADIHFFRVAHIPDAVRKILNGDCYCYLLSPSEYYWGDLSSDKERFSMQKIFQKKGIRQQERDAFDLYARDRHPLLANLVKYGTDLLDHCIDQNIPSYEYYEEGSRIKGDFLHLQISTEGPSGITLHKTPSKRREIEILYNNILALFHENPRLSLSDIRVYAPQIKSYFPAIQMVFGSQDSSLCNYAVSDLPNALIYKDLKKLLSLKDPFDLFYTEGFQQKFSLQKEDILTWKRWDEAGARDVLMSFALPATEWTIEPSDAPLLELFITLSEKLRKEMETLQQGSMTIKEWVLFLRDFTEYYLPMEEATFSNYLGELIGLPLKEVKFSFISPYIDKFFEAPSYTFRAAPRPELLFSNLGDGPILPLQHIFLLGMDEESFPSRHAENPLNELSKKKGYAFEPSASDRDRFAFLGALLSAESLTISYEQVNPEDGKIQAPSMIIQDLLNYLGNVPSIDHPSVSFHASYFSPEAKVKSFSTKEYRLASLHYKEEKTPLLLPKNPPPTTWSLKDLARLHHPLKFYAETALGLYLKEPETKEEFVLSYLERYQWKSSLKEMGSTELFERFQKKSKIKNPLFQKIALLELEKECQKIELFLEEHNLSSIGKITFHEECRKTFVHSEHHTVMPPLVVANKWRIVGDLPLSIVSFTKKKEKEICKNIPNLLVMNILKIPPQIFFTETGKVESFIVDKPEERLATFLRYADEAFMAPCPFTPAWQQDDAYVQYFRPFQDEERWRPIIEEALCLQTV